MRNGNVYVQFLGHIVRQSEKAIYFSALKPEGDFHPPEWLPKSQCMSIKETFDELEGTYDVLMISEWILSQKAGMLEAQREQARPKPKEIPRANIFDDDIPF